MPPSSDTVLWDRDDAVATITLNRPRARNALTAEMKDALLDTERLRAERFFAAYDGDARGLLARAWDLDRLARAYQRWLAMASDLSAGAGLGASDETVFARRSMLVHEWRKFLFSDPGLPAELLPARWPGHEAAKVFQAESARLLPGASRFVDRCLEGDVQSKGDPCE